MKTDLIFEDGNIRYKDKIYEGYQCNKLLSNIGNNIRVIVLGENILVKNYIVSRKSVKTHIKKIFENEIGYSLDLLMDYKYLWREEKVYTYTLKKVANINKVAEKAKKLEILPIQYSLVEYVGKFIKLYKEYRIIAKINGIIYSIDVENKVIKDCNIYNYDDFKEQNINLFIRKHYKTIVDTSIDGEKLINNNDESIIFMEIGEKLYEKICRI